MSLEELKARAYELLMERNEIDKELEEINLLIRQEYGSSKFKKNKCE